MQPSNPDGAFLNEPQSRHLLVNWQEIDRMMAEIESILNAGSSNSVFPKYKPELSPVQVRVIRDYIANIRRELLQSAKGLGIQLPGPDLRSVHSIRVDLIFAEIAAEECTPERMRGYGEVNQSAISPLRGMVEQLKTSLGKLATYLDEGGDLKGRLQRLDRISDETELLGRITDIVERRGMVEFRPSIAAIIERLSARTFEIAVFGRVSSGKSSLLNHILGTEVLPVGVTPVTAIPTRVMFGAEPAIEVSFAIGERKRLPIERLPEFASEQHNRGNEKLVTRIIVQLPSTQISEGIVFVDTPGLGSLATAGAAETLAYLPRCDLGVLLVDSASTLTEDDLGTIRMLLEAGIPASVLLSKADLIQPADRDRATEYTKQKIHEHLGVDLPVRPVSVAAGDDELLKLWFEDELAPVFRRHRELASESIRRKIGVLHESVMSALRTLLGRNEARNQPSPDTAQHAGHKLRDATGAFDEASRQCFHVLDLLRDAPGLVIGRIAREAALLLRNDKKQREVGSEWVRSTAQRIAAEQTRGLPGILAELALDSAAALIECAHDLNAPEAPSPSEFSTAIQEMPLMDIGSIEVSLRAGILGRKLTRFTAGLFETRLTDEIGQALSRAFSSYSTVLNQWIRSALKNIRLGFDAYAESYRATIIRVEGSDPSHEISREGGLETDLAALETGARVPAPEAQVQ